MNCMRESETKQTPRRSFVNTLRRACLVSVVTLLAALPSYPWTYYSGASVGGAGGTVYGWGVTDVTQPGMYHTAYVNATLTSPKGRVANNGIIQATSSVREDLSLPLDPNDLGNYLVTSSHSGFCHMCNCWLFENCGSGASVAELPIISGPQTVWWFNGATPSGYAVSITLSAWPTNCSSYSWTVSSGSDKANLSGQTANKTNVTGKALSTASGDVGVTVTAGGATSNPYPITVRGPKTLVAGATTDQCNSDYGYDSFLNYTIKDNLSALLLSSIPLSEKWTSAVTNDYTNANWRRGDAAGYTSPDSTFADHIQGEALSLPANPTPTCPPPLGSTPVQHWGQEWRVGSSTPGSGARVQTDNIQKYLDHARHTGIVSPAP